MNTRKIRMSNGHEVVVVRRVPRNVNPQAKRDKRSEDLDKLEWASLDRERESTEQ